MSPKGTSNRSKGEMRRSKSAKHSKQVKVASRGLQHLDGKGTNTCLANVNTPLLEKPNNGQVYNVVTGVALPTPPPSVVNAGSTVTMSTTTLGDEHQSKLFFEACQRNGRMENEVMLAKDLSSYVRYELFPRLKFIMSNAQLNFATKKNTICGLICADMGLVEVKASAAWWESYKNMIADVLNAKRADVTGAIKRVFMRKFPKGYLFLATCH